MGEQLLTAIIDEILDLLARDGKLHSIQEAAMTSNITVDECQIIATFLAKYNFIQLVNHNMKINPEIRDLIIETSDKMVLQIPNVTP